MSSVHVHEVQLRWSDADANGHINNTKYLTYAEDSRIRWMHQLPPNDGSSADHGAIILARQECDYWRQVLTEEDPVMEMRTVVTKIGRTSTVIRQDLWGRNDTTPANSTTCVLVCFDYGNQKSQPWNDAQLEFLNSYLEQPS